MASSQTRCPWGNSDPVYYVPYHDDEWGVPTHDDKKLFEMLTLEGAQAGLSWITILKKRDCYRRAFSGFNPSVIARYDSRKRQRLLANTGIVRNRLKIESTIKNARAFLAVQTEFGSFDRYIWQFVDGTPRQNTWTHMEQIPTNTPESDAMSMDLKRRGFSFVGPTICYALMQSIGMVNDHLVGCFRYQVVHALR
jgi:DNA-3-methyladenine glycosylase I